MKTALDVHRELLAREVRHEMVRMRGRLSSADELPRMLELTDGCGAVRCYTLTDPPGGAVAVLVASGHHPDLALLRAALRVHELRPATPDEVNAATDFAAGLVCPVGLPADVPLLVDAAVAARHVLYTAAGEGAVALGIRTRDLLLATQASVAALDGGLLIDLKGDQPLHLDDTERAGRRRG
jgi:prolyl-tRNA editing enzyme YbaK/EbsC (Cys-tRNA(Pro) deacylase)